MLSRTLQGALIDIGMLSSTKGPITKVEQMERICLIRGIVERAIAANAREAMKADH